MDTNGSEAIVEVGVTKVRITHGPIHDVSPITV